MEPFNGRELARLGGETRHGLFALPPATSTLDNRVDAVEQQQQQNQQHLLVANLYDDEDSQQRKSSISFDKIKQISLTYSMQSEEGDDEYLGDDVTKTQAGTGMGSNNDVNNNSISQMENGGGESSESFCLSPADERKISVIELGKSSLRLKEEELERISGYQKPKLINDKSGPEADLNGSMSSSAVVNEATASSKGQRYLDSNPFVNDQYDQQYNAPELKKGAGVNDDSLLASQPDNRLTSGHKSTTKTGDVSSKSIGGSGQVGVFRQVNYGPKRGQLLPARVGAANRTMLSDEPWIPSSSNSSGRAASVRSNLEQPAIGLKLKQHNNSITLVLYNGGELVSGEEEDSELESELEELEADENGYRPWSSSSMMNARQGELAAPDFQLSSGRSLGRQDRDENNIVVRQPIGGRHNHYQPTSTAAGLPSENTEKFQYKVDSRVDEFEVKSRAKNRQGVSTGANHERDKDFGPDKSMGSLIGWAADVATGRHSGGQEEADVFVASTPAANNDRHSLARLPAIPRYQPEDRYDEQVRAISSNSNNNNSDFDMDQIRPKAAIDPMLVGRRLRVNEPRKEQDADRRHQPPAPDHRHEEQLLEGDDEREVGDEEEEIEDDYGNISYPVNSIHATPIHSRRHQHRQHSGGTRRRSLDTASQQRIDIIISSPQRYARPKENAARFREPQLNTGNGRRYTNNAYLPNETQERRWRSEVHHYGSQRRPTPSSSTGSHNVRSNYGAGYIAYQTASRRLPQPEASYSPQHVESIKGEGVRHQRFQRKTPTNYYPAPDEITPTTCSQAYARDVIRLVDQQKSCRLPTSPTSAQVATVSSSLAGHVVGAKGTPISELTNGSLASDASLDRQRLQQQQSSSVKEGLDQVGANEPLTSKIKDNPDARLDMSNPKQSAETSAAAVPLPTTAAQITAAAPKCPLFATNPPPPPTKPMKLRNLATGEQTVDLLHQKYKQNNKSHGCTELKCSGSLINPKPVENKVRSPSETLEHARDFINNFYASIKRLDSPAHKNRLAEIEEQVRTTETYYLKETELIYGAKLAWRNAARCIGRIQWSKLQVFDARFTTNANEMFEALCNHIKYATNKGSLRSAITIMPQRVKSVKNDWRIWNSQLIGYAGYRNKETGAVVGDPINADFTEVCQRLGWQGKGTRFDVLPIVISAAGGPPQLFPLPEDLVLRVKLKHPRFKWFEELGLEWYALPAVANMMLDVGGLQFTAAPFSGWYMVTEIGSRDLADTSRYNVLEEVAQKMGLNTTSNMSLWKDSAMVELNIAVLDSFQQAGVTIVDHHTASETFMTHLSNEQRLRGGCPADWVWLVPPTSGSCTQVFHQEMANYHLLPNYEYMDHSWRNYDWAAWEQLQLDKADDSLLSKRRSSSIGLSPKLNGAGGPLSPARAVLGANGELTPRKLRFKEIARAVKFTSKLFGKALSRRIKATILYATETGKSERFANKLAQTFSCAFNVHLMSMSDYDMTCLEHEALLLIVTSTFGNGDPPENGELFAKHLAAVKLTGDTSPDIDSINSVSSNPFFQMLSEDHKDGAGGGEIIDRSGGACGDDDQENCNSLKAYDKQEQQTNIRPLSNVRFGVFALGSTAYPHFCAFGRYVDQTLGELGAERIMKCTCGDELCGQEKAFNEWSQEVFRTACDVFCLTDSIGPIEERPEVVWSPQDVRFVPVELIGDQDSPHRLQSSPTTASVKSNRDGTTKAIATNGGGAKEELIGKIRSQEVLTSNRTIVRNLMGITNKKIVPFTMKQRKDLHPFNQEENLRTLNIDLESEWISGPTGPATGGNNNTVTVTGSPNVGATKQAPISFEAGDHVAIYPLNKLDMVARILARMANDQKRNSNSGDTVGDLSTATRLPTAFDFDQVYTVLVKRENMDLTPASTMGGPQNPLTNGENGWIAHDRLPVTSIREALTRYLDITTPPNQEFLLILSRLTSDQEERKRLQQMARNFTQYEEWKNKRLPTLVDVLDEFKTVKFDPELVTQIPLMKPRFYSVSGVNISLTVGVVRFKTQSDELKEGLCSNYLNFVQMTPTSYIYGYIRSAPAFHMPQDKSIPMILISAGTGMAPFRSFWQQRHADMYVKQVMDGRQTFGRIDMYFGCRNSNYILYRDELNEMCEKGVISTISIAFSRPIDCDVFDEPSSPSSSSSSTEATLTDLNPNQQATSGCSENYVSVKNIKQARRKVYVQEKLMEHRNDINKLIMTDGAHVYVCGDVAMADGVYKTLANILGDDGESVLMNLRNLNRYHEDIFGAKQNV